MDELKEIAAFVGLWLGSVIIVFSVLFGIIWLFYASAIWGWAAVAVLFLGCVLSARWGMRE